MKMCTQIEMLLNKFMALDKPFFFSPFSVCFTNSNKSLPILSYLGSTKSSVKKKSQIGCLIIKLNVNVSRAEVHMLSGKITSVSYMAFYYKHDYFL